MTCAHPHHENFPSQHEDFIGKSTIVLLLAFVPFLAVRSTRNKLSEFGVGNVDKRGRRLCVQREGVPCEKTVADTEQPIAAPAWPSYGTRPPLRNLCVLRTVRAAGSGFRGRHRALCAGRGILGRLFGLSDAARPRNWRYVIAHRMRDKVTPASPRCCCTVTCTRPRAGRLHCATSRLATLNKRDFIARTRCAESASWCSCAPCACYIRT